MDRFAWSSRDWYRFLWINQGPHGTLSSQVGFGNMGWWWRKRRYGEMDTTHAAHGTIWSRLDNLLSIVGIFSSMCIDALFGLGLLFYLVFTDILLWKSVSVEGKSTYCHLTVIFVISAPLGWENMSLVKWEATLNLPPGMVGCWKSWIGGVKWAVGWQDMACVFFAFWPATL